MWSYVQLARHDPVLTAFGHAEQIVAYLGKGKSVGVLGS